MKIHLLFPDVRAQCNALVRRVRNPPNPRPPPHIRTTPPHLSPSVSYLEFQRLNYVLKIATINLNIEDENAISSRRTLPVQAHGWTNGPLSDRQILQQLRGDERLLANEWTEIEWWKAGEGSIGSTVSTGVRSDVVFLNCSSEWGPPWYTIDGITYVRQVGGRPENIIQSSLTFKW